MERVTVIRLRVETREKLAQARITKRETYDEVITRLLEDSSFYGKEK